MSKNFDYPKSSCNCYDDSGQGDELVFKNKGKPSNLAFMNCVMPNYFETHDQLSFKNNLQPTTPSLPYNRNDPYTQYNAYNSNVITEKYAKDFSAVKCNNSTLYISDDARLVDAPRSMMLNLNVPPIDSSVRLNQVYDDNLTNYGKKYSTYSDINTGQILYYTDKSIEEPYFQPNFVSTSSIDSVIYKDPMGSIKPHYYRKPLIESDNILTDKDKFTYSLSWLDDSIGFREDLMSKQMAKANQSRWSNRWT